MSNFAETEDISFSMGLSGLGLVDNLEATERRVNSILNRIGADFQNLKTTVESSGTNKYGENLTDLTRRAGNLNAQFREMKKSITDLNQALANSPGGSIVLSRELKTVVKLQQEVQKLKASMQGSSSGSSGVTKFEDDLARVQQKAKQLIDLLKFPGAEQHGELVRNVIRSIHQNLSELNKRPLDLDTRLVDSKLRKMRDDIRELFLSANHPMAGKIEGFDAGKRPAPPPKDTLLADARNVLSGGKALLGMPPASAMKMIQDQIKQIDTQIARLNARPIEPKTAKAKADLEALRSKLLQVQKGVQNVGATADTSAKNLQEMGNKGATAMKRVHGGGETLNQEFQKAGGILRNISTVLSTIGLGGGIFALIYGFKQLVKDGIEFNALVEQAKISLAAEVVASAKMVRVNGERVTGLEAIKAVQGQIGGVVEKLKTDALFVNGTFEDLLGIAQSIAPVVLRTGGNMEQVHRLTQLAGIAASVLGVSFKEAQTGLSQLLSGNYVGRNAFVKRLPVDDLEQFKKQIKDGTQSVELLINTLGKLEDAGPMIATAFKGVADSVRDLLQRVTGRVFEPVEERLKHIFNNIVNNGLIKMPDGTVKFADGLENTLKRASALVDDIFRQVLKLGKVLTSTNGRSFFDIAEETLPKIIDYIGTLLTAVKSVGEVLGENAGGVLKLAGYYLTLNLLVGTFNSLRGAVTSVNTAVDNVRGGMLTMKNAAVGATVSWQAFGTVLQGIASRILPILAIMIGMEFVNRLISAKKAANDFKEGLQDINSLRLDSAIGQVHAMTQALRESETGLSRLIDKSIQWLSLSKKTTLEETVTNTRQMTSQAVSKAFGVAREVGVDAPSGPNVDAGFLTPEQIAVSPDVIMRGLIATKKREDELQKSARGASFERREQIRKEIGDLGVKNKYLHDALALLEAADSLAQRARNHPDAKPGVINPILPFAGISAGVARARAGLTLTDKVDVTPGKIVHGEEDSERRIADWNTRVMNALEQAAQAQSRIVDKSIDAQRAQLEEMVSNHLISAQKAADEEIVLAQNLADRKLSIQHRLYEEISATQNKSTLVMAKKYLTGAKDGSALSFDDITGLDDGKVDEAIKNFAKDKQKESGSDPKLLSINTKSLDFLREVGRISTAILGDQERRTATIADNKKRIAAADDQETKFLQEQKKLVSERDSSARLEVQQAQDLSLSLEERIAREEEINEAIRQRRNLEIDNWAQQEKIKVDQNDTIKDGKQKEAMKQAIDSSAALQKDAAALQGKRDLTNSIVRMTDEEITLAAEKQRIMEDELAILRNHLGAENPVVILKENELKLARAMTLEAKAQAKFAESTRRFKEGDNTGARKAMEEGKVLQSQAKVFRDETANYLQVISTGMGRLADMLSHFSGAAGGIVGQFSQLFSGIAGFQKMGSIGDVFKSASGLFGEDGERKKTSKAGSVLGGIQGAIGVATGPLGSIATTAIGMFKSLFDWINGGVKKLIEQANKKLQDNIATIMSDVRVGKTSTAGAIADLQKQKGEIDKMFPEKKKTGWWEWLFPAVAVGHSISNHFANKAIEEGKESAFAEIDKQIEDLNRSAEEAVYNLQNKLLPSLRFTPAEREFAAQIQTIREEMQALAGTPGVNEADLNELFKIRLLDVQHSMEEQINSEKKNYVSILKEEEGLQKDLLDIAEQRKQVEEDFTQKRNQILGISTRELSKAEQLAKLEKDRQDQLTGLAEREKEDRDRLELITKQRDVYQEQFGVVKDIHDYEMQAEQFSLDKTKEKIAAMREWLQDTKDFLNTGLGGMIDLTKAWYPSAGGGAVNINLNGPITLGPGMTADDAKDMFIEGYRAANQEMATKGLAFSNA